LFIGEFVRRIIKKHEKKAVGLQINKGIEEKETTELKYVKISDIL